MIELTIPVEQIPYIRTIEGRKFHNGKWQFPDSSLKKLTELGLISKSVEIKISKNKNYNLSPFLYKYQKEIVNTALNKGSYGIFFDI